MKKKEKPNSSFNSSSSYNAPTPPQTNQYSGYDLPKSGVGIAMGIFLGLIGLIIGVLLYPTGTNSRETFIKGWVKGFIIGIVISVIISVFSICAMQSMLNNLY